MKRFDLYLTSAMVFIALVWFIFNNIFYSKAEIVNVYKDNILIESYSLEVNGEYSINDLNEELMRISIKNKMVDVVYANCPDKLCVHQLSISKGNETIVCLPNKIVVTVEDKNTNTETDAITF